MTTRRRRHGSACAAFRRCWCSGAGARSIGSWACNRRARLPAGSSPPSPEARSADAGRRIHADGGFAQTRRRTMPRLDAMKIAILVTDGFEQVELTQPQRVLEQEGADTMIVSPKPDRVRGWKHGEWG